MPSEETNRSPTVDSKNREIHEMTEKELRITLLKKFREL